MKKLIIITMIISSTLSIAGCSLSKPINQESDSSSTVEAKQEDNLGSTQDTSDKENDNNKSIESKTNDTTTNKTDKKEYYTQKLNDIQAKIDKDYNFNNTITTKDMRSTSGAQYKFWDDALNEIYKELQKTLPSSDMEKLKKEELAWISKKESDAKDSGDKAKGGTLEPVKYTLSAADSTKKRCYELVKNYMQ
ncbi:hypothetical protein psyc5s11_25020 [Clostridium gelidum]|uniref:Lysozyme inhibitor LprI-like N-terminal domain-containing protein n=1 Tax=Clostridium gelidum TaxID=704125 RepID=A0ABN6IWB8_9CLOT|nr:lysozyme inhibitor LprI family protein [Clostridium gelidum]BCZ46435.1 hypothetical protein psyc5s11_25020 [Clostridium gelidum]